MKYNIIVASRNAMEWLPESLDSILNQDHDNFEVCVVDDFSADKSQPAFVKEYCELNGWSYILNDHHRGAMANHVAGIKKLAPESDEEVIVIVDGDDQLFHNGVLSRLDEYYVPGVHMTYGGSIDDPPTIYPTHIQPYPPQVIRDGTYRTYGLIHYGHLRTFKYGLFKQLDEDVDFKWPNGEWFQACCDSAVMIPCLELAGPGGHAYITEPMYRYNSANPSSDWRTRNKEIDRIHYHLLHALKSKV